MVMVVHSPSSSPSWASAQLSSRLSSGQGGGVSVWGQGGTWGGQGRAAGAGFLGCPLWWPESPAPPTWALAHLDTLAADGGLDFMGHLAVHPTPQSWGWPRSAGACDTAGMSVQPAWPLPGGDQAQGLERGQSLSLVWPGCRDSQHWGGSWTLWSGRCVPVCGSVCV